jgi:hypothetical protein
MAIFPQALVVIFFRAPGGRGIYKKLLEPTQRPTNPYMGWATPPTTPIESSPRWAKAINSRSNREDAVWSVLPQSPN